MSVASVGVDLGSSKTVIIQDDADIVLTETGGIARPSLVSFFGKTRLVGEEAAAQVSSDSTLGSLNLLIGKSLDEVASSSLHVHRKAQLSQDAQQRLTMTSVNYNDASHEMFVTSLLGMFLAKQEERIAAVTSSKQVKLAFALAPDAPPSVERAIREACSIARIDPARICTADAVDCLMAAYTRKVNGLRPAERSVLENKRVVLIDMGHTQTTIVVLQLPSTIAGSTGSNSKLAGSEAVAPEPSVKISYAHDGALGAQYFDLQLFTHFAAVCQSKHSTEVTPGSKRGQRLLLGCERIRKLLSQLPDSSITVENMTDSGDVSFSLTRRELQELCADQLTRFKTLLTTALANGSVVPSDIFAIEVLGGGVRMQVVQGAISEIFGDAMTLGAKLDDGSLALGATLVANKRSLQEEEERRASMAGKGNGLTPEEVEAAAVREQEMQAQDREIQVLLAARNAMEAYILDMRSAPRRKHGHLIDASTLNASLEEAEGWLWDFPDSTLAELQARDAQLREAVTAACGTFFEVMEREKLQTERELDAESMRAAAVKAVEGEKGGDEEDDHDNRKLKKADRMRLVVKNKEEGTELFKGGVFRTAAARYHKALSHSTKFFDLTPADEAEVKALRVSLYLNLALCYSKMSLHDQVINNCGFALEIEPKNAKAFFRRSSAWEAKREWDKALEDAKTSATNLDVEDKQVSEAIKRIKAEIAKDKKKEADTWKKAFNK